jgi:hypothetical protein
MMRQAESAWREGDKLPFSLRRLYSGDGHDGYYLCNPSKVCIGTCGMWYSLLEWQVWWNGRL